MAESIHQDYDAIFHDGMHETFQSFAKVPSDEQLFRHEADGSSVVEQVLTSVRSLPQYAQAREIMAVQTALAEELQRLESLS